MVALPRQPTVLAAPSRELRHLLVWGASALKKYVKHV
jgi:hypothetical protein